jgi:hypothetical protein
LAVKNDVSGELANEKVVLIGMRQAWLAVCLTVLIGALKAMETSTLSIDSHPKRG